ncbi:MAG TPA: 50S ribosomal protein L9 [Thermoleophilia bacterium]|jgi:large subunit ribosomal protein L9|nr:50S ribosomal protein L9 [Acidobacteriota bacterium]OPZ46004.1 MAG: 50S ribosomal protein L9 [Actinobacteria bacterium ADurb.BinA094]HOU28324.1 50S ribosomal protein L9 [Thermoleophilia bacterium]HQF52746.1 50S ribosomal protein L9 [Thermoleophilia bacterium]HQH22044.1 50S ribosomal protein L9 [Thermoleophilia bacterium]
MEVILLQDVEHLGEKGQLANVARGYARNYLIPRRLAEVATPGRVVEFHRREEERKAREARRAVQAEEYTAMLNRTVITVTAKAGEGDRLFGSVTAADVADAIKDARGITVDKRKVLLEEPIKELGTFQVDVEVAEGFVASVKTIVVPA